MRDPQVETLVRMILDALPKCPDVDSSVRQVINNLENLFPGYSATHADQIEEARREVERQFEQVEIVHRHSIIRPRERWYFGPRPTDRHWPAFRGYIEKKGWASLDIERLDEASSEIVSLIENPAKNQFSCRGMVVGFVQSGKTANMTAVIAKAVDAGYNTVIVLAGLTNKLRFQTQVRLFEDLVSRNELDWNVRTPNIEDIDFRAPPQGGFLTSIERGKAQIAVVKKNVSPLRQLKIAVDATHPVALRQLRVLVIDDECDQASVNAGRGELDVTTINQHIRDLLGMLPAVTYIGYTATPFANVLIDPYRTDPISGKELDDLYPKDFITALPPSPNYFGTERLFGRIPEDPENIRPEEEGLDMIREIPEKDQYLLQPASARRRNAFMPSVAGSLEEAILYFLACCSARRARGDGNRHMTMLIHTSAYVIEHGRVADCVRNWVEQIRHEVKDPSSPTGRRLAQVWEREQGRLPPDITAARPVTTEELFHHLPDVLDALEFPVENGASDDRIDYRKDTPRTYIVVGGSILARGLTLEGLMVSYFLRSANQYDTLLQMGRWFGYRQNYEDLPRIWMPDDLQLKFRQLARIEIEIREDIERYRLERLTPMDVAVRIRAIPGMAITGVTKMRAARTCTVSFWGTHRQTFRFHHLDSRELCENWQAASDLLDTAERYGRRNGDSRRHLWTDVPKDAIVEFLGRYRFHPSHRDLQPDMLLAFVRQRDERLKSWNVGLVGSYSAQRPIRPLGPIQEPKLVRRAKLKMKDMMDTADIKALMSKGDIWFDCDGDLSAGKDWEDLKDERRRQLGERPLLLLYPIDRVSTPRNLGPVREALNAADEVMGVGIVFPGSVTEGGEFVSVELRPLSADELDEIEAEEEAQVEAAGV